MVPVRASEVPIQRPTRQAAALGGGDGLGVVDRPGEAEGWPDLRCAPIGALALVACLCWLGCPELDKTAAATPKVPAIRSAAAAPSKAIVRGTRRSCRAEA